MTSQAAAVPWRARRARLVTAVREKGEALTRLSLTGMSRKDAARWRSARNMTDLGELVIDWLNGDITQTPGHCGPPCDETVPLIPALTVINRGGFITDCSQLAESAGGRSWNTWVEGFAGDATLAALRRAVDGTPLELHTCRGKVHGCRPIRSRFQPCPRGDVTDFWTSACPDASGDLWGSWWVYIEDPEPGRNDLLWPALTAALSKGR